MPQVRNGLDAMIIHAEKPICGYWCETCRLQFQAPDCSHWEEEPSHQMVPVMPVTAVHALRCISHRTVLPYNREASGGECAACAVESEKRAGPPREDGQCEDCSENKWVTFDAKLTVCAECGCAVTWEQRPEPPVEAAPAGEAQPKRDPVHIDVAFRPCCDLARAEERKRCAEMVRDEAHHWEEGRDLIELAARMEEGR